MKDLIHRLRDTASRGVSVWGDLQMEAADALTRLTAVSLQPAHDQVTIECLNDKVMYLQAQLDRLTAEKGKLFTPMCDAFVYPLPSKEENAWDVALPEPRFDTSYHSEKHAQPAFMGDQLIDYGNRCAAAAVLAERERIYAEIKTMQGSTLNEVLAVINDE